MTAADADTASTDDGAVAPGAWTALAVAAAGFVLFGFNSTATNLAFNAIAETFSGASETTVSWVASGYFIASAALLPLGGRLADRVGPRRIFDIGLVGFAVSAVASAVAPTIGVLIGARVVQAISGAFVVPSSLSMVLPQFPLSRRSSAVGMWAAAGPLSAALAPSTAAALLEATSWRWVYALTAPVAAIILVLSMTRVRAVGGVSDDSRLDLPGTVLAAGSVSLLIFGITQSPAWGVTSLATVATVVLAAVLAVAFVARSRRHPAPLVNLGLFRIPEVAVANVANLFMSVTSLSIWLIWPLWLGRVWGYSTAQIGLAITVGPVFAGPASVLGGRLADRWGHRWLMIGGSALATASVTWSVFRFGPEPDYVATFLPTLICFGFGWGLSNPAMNAWALATVPQSVYGEVNAAFNTVRNLGAAIGTSAGIAIVGSAGRVDELAAYDRAHGFFAASVGLSCLTVAAGTTWIGRQRRRQAATGISPAGS